MLLVAADTSGKNGSIALARAPEFSGPDPDRVEILEVVPLEGGTFSAQLIPQIAALLSKHGFRKEDVAGYAVASGPGSFTGLRVGLAAIKALGEVTGRPIAAVSLLEVLALLTPTTRPVIAAIDAGRGEAYAGEYRIDDSHQAIMVSERLLTKNELLEAARGLLVVTADAGLAELARAAGLVVTKTESPRSDAIARVGWTMLRSKRTVSPEELEANYIRRSDAEIFSKPPKR